MLIEALIELYGRLPGLTIRGKDDITEWPYEGIPIPSKAELAVIEADYIVKTAYVRQREREYPAVIKQLEMLYDDKKNGTNAWVEMIDAVKVMYPKPE